MAGSWAASSEVSGYLNGTLNRPQGMSIPFTSDAADASVPDLQIAGISGHLESVEVVFDGTDTPTSVITTVKTVDDTALPGFPSATLSASGWAMEPGETPLCFSGGLKVALTVVGNGKKGKVILNIL